MASQRNLGAAPQAPEYVDDVSVDDDPMRGKEDAPVTIVEFSDYECPFCARFASNLDDILKNNEGRIRYVLRDFPLETIHPNAFKAAEAANCAGDQGQYWAMHDVMFANNQQLGIDRLKEYASQLKLDRNQFEECLNNDKYAEEVRNDLMDGQLYQVTGTPTFFINGRRLTGPSLEELQQAIDEALEGG